MLFKRFQPAEPTDKPDDERELEEDARVAITESKKQLTRARNILTDEVKRLDSILNRG